MWMLWNDGRQRIYVAVGCFVNSDGRHYHLGKAQERRKKHRSKLSCEAWRLIKFKFPSWEGSGTKAQTAICKWKPASFMFYFFIIDGDTCSSVHLNPPELLVNFHYNQSIWNGRLVNSGKSIDDGAPGSMPNIREKMCPLERANQIYFLYRMFLENAGVHRHKSE